MGETTLMSTLGWSAMREMSTYSRAGGSGRAGLSILAGETLGWSGEGEES